MQGRWFDISEEVQDQVDASGYQQKWTLDPEGYFLIRINAEEKLLEVGHCTTDNKLIRVVKGSTPEEIMYKMIDSNHLSLKDHCAYLGKELQKAHTALHFGFKYVQDSPLEKTK
jgi:tetrahydromethanopterin S-methyltransferase subunit A